MKLGLWDKNAVELNALGGIKKMKGDPLLDAKGYDTNFIKWYFDHVLPIYEKMRQTRINAFVRTRCCSGYWWQRHVSG